MKRSFDTATMNLDEMDELIKSLRTERARKLKAEQLTCRMTELLQDAKEEGFFFVSTTTGMVLKEDWFTLFDEMNRFE